MPDTNLYVGNLPWDTTKEELAARFTNYGDIRSTRIIVDKETGRSRGFGFVEFADAASAQAALAEDDTDFGGRALRVNIANRQREDRPHSAGGGHRNGDKRKPRGERRPRLAHDGE